MTPAQSDQASPNRPLRGGEYPLAAWDDSRKLYSDEPWDESPDSRRSAEPSDQSLDCFAGADGRGHFGGPMALPTSKAPISLNWRR